MSDRVLCLIAFIAASVLGGPLRASELGDPTRPPESRLHPVADVSVGQALVLSAIFLSDAGPAAVIDGHRVVPGDRLGDRRVDQIRRDGVILSGPEGSLELRLAPRVRRSEKRAGGAP